MLTDFSDLCPKDYLQASELSASTVMTTGHALRVSLLDKHKEPGYVANASGILPPDRAPARPTAVPACGAGLLGTLDTKGHLQLLITTRLSNRRDVRPRSVIWIYVHLGDFCQPFPSIRTLITFLLFRPAVDLHSLICLRTYRELL